MLIEETSDSRIGDEPVSPLHQSMTLILEAHVFDGYVPLAQCRHDLLGLTIHRLRLNNLRGWPFESSLLGVWALELHLLFHSLQLGFHVLLSGNLAQFVLERIIRTRTQ